MRAARDGHSSATPVARRLKRPTRMAGPDRPGDFSSRHSYSILLPVGFAVPLALPPTRCALTAPFHPYRGKRNAPRRFAFLWHFPWGFPRRTLSGTVYPWSPDFPPRRPFGLAGAAVQPTDAGLLGGDAAAV